MPNQQLHCFEYRNASMRRFAAERQQYSRRTCADLHLPTMGGDLDALGRVIGQKGPLTST